MSNLTREQYTHLCEIESAFLSKINKLLEENISKVTSVKLKFDSIYFHLTNGNDERAKSESSNLVNNESGDLLAHMVNDIDHEHKNYLIEMKKVFR